MMDIVMFKSRKLEFWGILVQVMGSTQVSLRNIVSSLGSHGAVAHRVPYDLTSKQDLQEKPMDNRSW